VLVLAGCRSEHPAEPSSPVDTIRIGFGLASSQTVDVGLLDTARSITQERLLVFGSDGRPLPRLAESWSTSEDGLMLELRLREGVTFHDGSPLTPELIRDRLKRDLPNYMADSFEDVQDVAVGANGAVQIRMNRISSFVMESLDVFIEGPGDPPTGTGPFYFSELSGNQVEVRANDRYYGGKPSIERILIQPYSSVRTAWAEMLRGNIDMLYEVGVDALDLIEPSSGVQIFAFERPYAYMAVLNARRPFFRSPVIRHALNMAVDRETFISKALNSHGKPAISPIWPRHWASDPDMPTFSYQPAPEVLKGLEFRCLFSDSSVERQALELQRQLSEVGVTVELEFVPVDQVLSLLEKGEFDAFLGDIGIAPTMIRPFQFWYSGARYNWGGFSSATVDAALDRIRHAPDDKNYKAAVSELHRAILEDPPAIFLAWSERARAVSTRFEVPAKPGSDILGTLRLWRPVADKQTN
jgi:peptide/nickel transport system substrate-binding protein